MEIKAYPSLIEESLKILLGENAYEITHKGSCDEVHPDMSHEEWEKEQRIEGEEEPSESELEDIVNVESVELGESKFSEIDMHLKDGKSPKQIAKIMNLPLADVTSVTKDVRSAYRPNRPK